MKGRKKLFLGAAVLLVLVVAVGLIMHRAGEEAATVEVQPGNIARTVEDTGYVQPVTSHDLYATQSARVIRVEVESGQAVTQGQNLAVLESIDLALQVNEARSQLTQVTAAVGGARPALELARLEKASAADNLERVRELHQAGAATLVEYERAVLQLEGAQRLVDEQESRLNALLAQEAGLNRTLQHLAARESQLVVTSPIDGKVLSLPVKAGQVVMPGVLLAVVGTADRLEIKADILSDDLAEVELGQRVTVTAPVLGRQALTGMVKQIYPGAEERMSVLGVIQRRVPVIIELNETSNLRPGYEVKVAIATMFREDVLVAPREAVRTTTDGQREVLAVVDGRVERRVVQTGLSDRQKIEIIGGLAAGELILRDASLNFPDGTRIGVRP